MPNRRSLQLARRLMQVIAAALICFAALASAGAQTSNFPGQYVARLYTEALGRAPDPAGWAGDVTYFSTNKCSLSTLKGLSTGSGNFFNNNSEFLADNPDPQSQVVAMYRAILNRDPDSSAFGTGGYYDYLVASDTPARILVVADDLYASSEFASLANAICGVYTVDSIYTSSTYIPGYNNFVLPKDPNNPEFPIGTGPAYNTAVLPNNCTSNCVSTYAGLVSALSGAPSGKIINLLPGSLIKATAKIVIPAGVTVQTTGTTTTPSLTPHNYTQMARIVRSAQFNGALIQLDSGAVLQSVWVDGQRNVLGYNNPSGGSPNLNSIGGTGTTVKNNRIMEPQGGSNFVSNGAGESGVSSCTNLQVTGNLITAYTSSSTRPWDGGGNGPSDGLTMQCEDATIENNQIVDVSDIAIVLFGEADPVNQHSFVSENTILSAGISLNAGLSTDPISALPTQPAHVCYNGTTIENNTLWTSPNTAFVFAIEAGSRAYWPQTQTIWDGSCAGGIAGPVYLNNITPAGTTPTLSALSIQGYSVQGMQGTSITLNGSNTFNRIPANVSLMFPDNTAGSICGETPFLAESGSPSAGLTASGLTPSSPSSTVDLDYCYAGVVPH